MQQIKSVKFKFKVEYEVTYENGDTEYFKQEGETIQTPGGAPNPTQCCHVIESNSVYDLNTTILLDSTYMIRMFE